MHMPLSLSTTRGFSEDKHTCTFSVSSIVGHQLISAHVALWFDCCFFFALYCVKQYEMELNDVKMGSSRVKGLTSGGPLASARKPKELSHVAHVLQSTQTVDVLVSGAVDGVDGAAAQLQPPSKSDTTLRKSMENRRAWAAARLMAVQKKRGACSACQAKQ